MLSVETSGVAGLKLRMDRRKVAARKALHASTGDSAEDLLDKALTLVPKDTMNLYDSGRIEEDGLADFAVAFGGRDADYAVYVHEILENQHTPPTQAKYLEAPFDANKKRYSNNIKAAVSRAVKRAI